MTSLRTSLTASLGFAALVGIAATSALGEGGADPASAVAIPALPFTDTGDTTGGTDDWDEVCPYTGSTSPDHWYSYTPATDALISIDLCPSGFDTKTYILDSNFVDIACDDDGCPKGGGPAFRSLLTDAQLIGGGTYYIVIDGWSGDAGFYDLTITVDPPQCEVIECAGTPEGEPCDDSGAPDTVNGGCNNTPAVFGSVDCGETICGTTWGVGGNRDIDWYEVNLVVPDFVTQTVLAESALRIVALTGISNGVCGSVGFSQGLTLVACIEGSLTECYQELGTTYFVVGNSDWDTLPCGSEHPGNDYVMTITCGDAPPIPRCELGDANGDCHIGHADLVVVLDNWGSCGTPSCCTLGDPNEDGEVGFADLLIVLENWSQCPPCS